MSMQCLNNNLNICIQTRPFTAIADATVYVWLYCTLHIPHKPDIYRCIYSCCDRLGLYAEIQIIFGTVYILGYMLTPYNTHMYTYSCSLRPVEIVVINILYKHFHTVLYTFITVHSLKPGQLSTTTP